jgi:hypothetical protein
MSASALLSRLDGVRQTGPGRWIAKCPAHDDRHPSLSIREGDDGRILLHDFAGCDVGEILGTLGLEFDALFPERLLGHQVPRQRRPFNPYDVLQCVAHEALLTAIAARQVANGAILPHNEIERLFIAAGRLDAAKDMTYGT